MVQTPDVSNEVNEDEIIVGKEGQVQLPLSALKQDIATPGESMGNLMAFTASLDDEVEEAKRKREQLEAEEARRLEEERLEYEKKNQFQDVVVDEVEPAQATTTSEPVAAPDLTSLKVKKVDTKNKVKLFSEQLLKKKARAFSTKVPLPNSGYTASVIGLSSPEMRNYSETLSGLDRFGQMEFKYKTLYSKIVETSIGDMDFDTFLNKTALLEYEILSYALFSSTFPEKSTYPYNCPKCNTRSDFTYYNKQYLDTHEGDTEKRAKTLNAMREVLKGQAISAKELFEESETSKLTRKYLKDSKIVVELRHPTLHDQLYDVINNATEDLIVNNEALINLMPFIKTVYYPTDETVDGAPEDIEYITLDDIDMKVNALNTITDADDDELAMAIEKNILEKYTIQFTLRPPKCPFCGHMATPEPVNFEQMLFMTRQIRTAMRNS